MVGEFIYLFISVTSYLLVARTYLPTPLYICFFILIAKVCLSFPLINYGLPTEVRGQSAGGFLLPSCGFWELNQGQACDLPCSPAYSICYLKNPLTHSVAPQKEYLPGPSQTLCTTAGLELTHPSSNAALLITPCPVISISYLSLSYISLCLRFTSASALPECPQSAVQAQLRSTTLHKVAIFSNFFWSQLWNEYWSRASCRDESS